MSMDASPDPLCRAIHAVGRRRGRILGLPRATRSCSASRTAAAAADVPILADLSSRHARIRRDGEGYLIEALREVRVDGRPVGGTTGLPTAAGSSWARRCGCCFAARTP